MADPNNGQVDELLEYLRITRGFDFSAYKRSTLLRRIQKRMQMVGVAGPNEYLDYLQVHQEEFSLLFNTILINVTGFFRDPDAWEYIRTDVVPKIIESKTEDEPIRLWSAGCASGEEAYTLAALFADALGHEQFKKRVKVYATDLDENALSESRQAEYSAKDLEDVDPDIVAKYFIRGNGGTTFFFDRGLRNSVIFGRHDLIADAPISRVDLIACRNTLMYFNSEVQEKILRRFYFALNEGGFLFLGKAETMLTHGNIFVPENMVHRVFLRGRNGNNRERLLSLGNGDVAGQADAATRNQLRLRELALDASPIAQIVIQSEGHIVLVNERARAKFGITLRDIGRPLRDLEISYRPIELRSQIEQVHKIRTPITIREVPWQQAGEATFLDIQIVPLNDNGAGPGSVSVTFTDVSEFKRLQDDLLQFNQELETAYEELQSTNEELQTTNEELQSTIEELETTNEELQSTNEELETMNEELQSTNEELQTINEQLRLVGDDLNKSNAFLASVLASFRAGVIVVDTEMKVLAWNDHSRSLWGLREDEVRGRHLLNLDIGFPVERLRQPVRSIITEQEPSIEFKADAVNRRGKTIGSRIACSPLRGSKGEILGAIVSIEEED